MVCSCIVELEKPTYKILWDSNSGLKKSASKYTARGYLWQTSKGFGVLPGNRERESELADSRSKRGILVFGCFGIFFVLVCWILFHLFSFCTWRS